MTTKRVERAALLRGIWFDKNRNYCGMYSAYGCGRHLSADTLRGMYKLVMTFPRLY